MSTSTRRRKAERQAQQKRQQQLTILIVVITVAVIAVALIAIASIPPEAPVQAAEASENYAGLERGVSENGYPQLGSPDAPVLITEYSSFGCGHCANFHDLQFPQLLDDVRAGSVRFEFVPVNLGSTTVPATNAAYCALDQGLFWEMHDVLFAWLRQFGANAFATSRILSVAGDIGLDANAFAACINASETQQRTSVWDEAFRALAVRYPEVTGTPTLTFNGVPPEFGSGGPTIDFIRQQITELGG